MKLRNLSIKHALLLTSLFLVLFSGPASNSVRAQGSSDTITVTGSADVKVVPDQVILSLGVEIWNADLAAAKTTNDEIVKKVLALAPTYNVKPNDAQTDYINVQPTYDTRSDTGIHPITGYFVRKTITIVLHDLSKFDDLLSATLEAGVNNVYGIDFQTTDLRKYRDQARSLAIQAAKEKADGLAKQLGMTVGKATTIQEYQTGYTPYYNNFGNRQVNQMNQNVTQGSGQPAPSDTSGQTTFAPGQIDVSASVNVTFALQ